MSRVTIREWYRRVNETWLAAGRLSIPPVTDEEAIKAASKLYRFALGRPYVGNVAVTRGNRYSYIVRGELRVNPGSGWTGGRGIVHLLSHAFHQRLSSERPHGAAHARLEIRMIKEVIRRGWLDGKLKAAPKPVKPKPDAKVVKLARTEASIERWERKLKRAQNALKKLRRRQAYYTREPKD